MKWRKIIKQNINKVFSFIKNEYTMNSTAETSIDFPNETHCCEICSFTTKNKYYFKRHLSTKKHVNMQFFPGEYVESCKRCNKKFKTKNGMILHLLKCASPIVGLSSLPPPPSPLLSQKGKVSDFIQKSIVLKKEFSHIFENINKNIELYNTIRTSTDVRRTQVPK
jgi:hypothetical protein